MVMAQQVKDQLYVPAVGEWTVIASAVAETDPSLNTGSPLKAHRQEVLYDNKAPVVNSRLLGMMCIIWLHYIGLKAEKSNGPVVKDVQISRHSFTPTASDGVRDDIKCSSLLDCDQEECTCGVSKTI